MRIGYIGGHWHTNIGNSFYNIGALHLLKKLYPGSVYFIPDPAQEYWAKLKNDYKFIDNLDLDLLIITGPSFGGKFIDAYKSIFDSFKKKNKQIGFLSIGAVEYTEKETEKIANFLKKYNIRFVATRDSLTYNFYKDKINAPIYDGICTSMFLSDSITVPKLDDKYYVFNFDQRSEPFIFKDRKNNFIYKKKSVFKKSQTDLNGLNVIRTSSVPFVRFSKLIYNRPNIYWSSSPEGYLSIYKSAETVFADRVHTCCAALIMGSKSMYVKVSKRSKQKRYELLLRLGLENIFTKPCSLDFNFIRDEKNKLFNFLSNNL